LHRNRTNSCEEVQKRGKFPTNKVEAVLKRTLFVEYQVIHAKVDNEITKMIEARKRSSKEAVYRRHRDEVEQHYKRLKSSEKDRVFPSLAQFRRLPIINILQSKTSTSTGVASDLRRSELVAELLQDDLKNWRESAKSALAAALGFPDWKSASKKKLHPVDRLTARFRCKRCESVGRETHKDMCLDFAGVCAHTCDRLNADKRTKEKWASDQFERDAKVPIPVTYYYPIL
jgi:hypothetical protein